jgi:uncharacterized protein YfdQ (DUF2303 family)
VAHFDDGNELRNSVEDLVRLGAEAAPPREVPGGNIPYALVPEGFNIQSLESFIHNEHRLHPERVKAHVGVLDPESFIEYYTLFSDPNSRIFASEPDLKVLAVLDYHGAKEGGPRWGHHKLELKLRQSTEWQRWNKQNNQQLTQQAFAEFLEQNAIDISSPSPAAMMEVARDLEAKTDVEFGSGLRMQSGQVQLKYTETIKTTVGGGQIEFPDRFTLSVPVFVGAPRISMDALLRFRIREGKLILWFTLIRPEEVQRTAFLNARDQIASTLEVVVINGTP